jgi:hypothetical protein
MQLSTRMGRWLVSQYGGGREKTLPELREFGFGRSALFLRRYLLRSILFLSDEQRQQGIPDVQTLLPPETLQWYKDTVSSA